MNEETSDYAKSRLQVELEVDTNLFSLGYIKGFVEGFKRGSQAEKTNETELRFVTKVTLEKDGEYNYEYCEVIRNGEEEK